jgi:hypothetical protein
VSGEAAKEVDVHKTSASTVAGDNFTLQYVIVRYKMKTTGEMVFDCSSFIIA